MLSGYNYIFQIFEAAGSLETPFCGMQNQISAKQITQSFQTEGFSYYLVSPIVLQLTLFSQGPFSELLTLFELFFFLLNICVIKRLGSLELVEGGMFVK